jgi:viroplasmin and RNaseH domain-containing protein
MWKRAFYYAVACGRKVGIFRSWAEAGPQVTGFPNNWHQKFTTKEEAREYLEGHRSVDVEMPRVPSFYAVAQGREVGIYRNWHQAEKQVSSYPNARYKKFSNERDALDFIERFRGL